MKSFLAVTATLAAIALCAGESAAQTSMITPSSIGATSALGTGPGGFAANAQGAVLPYSETPSPAPCTTGNPATTMLPTFDGGGFTLSVGATMSGLPPAASGANGMQVPCPSVSTSGITATLSTNWLHHRHPRPLRRQVLLLQIPHPPPLQIPHPTRWCKE